MYDIKLQGITKKFEAFTAAKAATQSPNNEQEPIVNPIPPQVVRENEVKQEITANFAETN